MSQTPKAEQLTNTADLIGTVLFTAVVFAALGIFVLVLLFAYQKKYIKHLKTQENLKLENERNLLNAQIEVKEQTLKDTGADLHDHVGQLLSLVKLQLASQNDEKTKYTRELVQSAIDEVRDISHRLNLDWAKDADLISLLDLEIRKLEKAGQFEISCEFPEEPIVLKNEYKILLLRCIQEAIQNIIKHANATKIEFLIFVKNQILNIKISDNGQGFDSKICIKSAGLTNMASRIKTIGGEFKITSNLGNGCICEFILSLDN